MARLYKLEVQRDSLSAVLYYHDDGSLELVDPDSGMPIDYLKVKLALAGELFEWMTKHNVTNWECSKVV